MGSLSGMVDVSSRLEGSTESSESFVLPVDSNIVFPSEVSSLGLLVSSTKALTWATGSKLTLSMVT